MKFLKSITNILLMIFLLSINSFSQLKMDENLYNDIQQKVSLKYGDSVDLRWIYQIDSLELYDGYYPLPYQISDPYGTLAHTTIFTAIKETQFSCKGLVGVYKNGNIIWDSDTTMNCAGEYGNYTGLVIFSVSDINRDGKVDVILSSILLGPTNYSAVQKLYAYSWDGNNGWLITDTNSEGKSTLESLKSLGDFDFVDVDGDGIYEITADWHLNEENIKTRRLVYNWNGNKYVFDPSKPQPQPYDFLVQNNIDVSLKASVQKVDSLYKYNYVLRNLPNSKQEIKYFYLKNNSDSLYSSTEPQNWYFVGSSGLCLFACLEDPNLFYDKVNFIKRGSLETFNFLGKGLPSIVKFFIQAYNQEPAVYDTVEGRTITYDDLYNNIFTNSKSGYTIAISNLFDSLENVEIIDTLISYSSHSFELDWIKTQSTANKYDSLFNLAKTQLQQNNNNAARTTLQTIIQQVDLDSTNNLTSEAYALIKYNTEYLLQQIPEQPANPNLVVNLKNSQGVQISASNVMYYEGSWKDAVNNGDGTFTVVTTKPTVSIRVYYEYASQQVDNVPAQNNNYTFTTVNAAVQLKNSAGNLIDQGAVQYYAGAWRSFGTTSNGVAYKELLPINYSFRMTYEYASVDKQQNLSSDPTVVFQTVNAAVQLKNSLGNLIDQGTVQYYAGAWRSFGTTSNGVAYKELLPINYSFRMTYEYVSKDKQQNLSTNPVVDFSTVLCTVKVSSTNNQPLNNAEVKYYSGAWRNLGTTNADGIAEKELLPANLSFRASYDNLSLDKQQDISINNLVEILLNVP